MHAALAPAGDQPRPLQHPLHPAVAELNLVLGLQFFGLAGPVGVLLLDAAGNLYGSASIGGKRGGGVLELSPEMGNRR